MIIEDGTGSGNKAKVTDENQIVVAAVVQGELEHESEENGAGYNWCSDTVNIDANDTVLLVKNDSSTTLHIEYVDIDNGSLASEYTLHLPTTEVTVTGTIVTGSNINTGIPNVAEATAASDETNNTQGNVHRTVFLEADDGIRIMTPGVILGKNKSIAVDVVENTTESSVSIVAHYSD